MEQLLDTLNILVINKNIILYVFEKNFLFFFKRMN